MEVARRGAAASRARVISTGGRSAGIEAKKGTGLALWTFGSEDFASFWLTTAEFVPSGTSTHEHPETAPEGFVRSVSIARSRHP